MDSDLGYEKIIWEKKKKTTPFLMVYTAHLW
jgi:hypothetical protein